MLPLETLERYAAAFRLFYEGNEPSELPKLTPRENLKGLAKRHGEKAPEARFLLKLKSLANISERNRKTLLLMARRLAASKE